MKHCLQALKHDKATRCAEVTRKGKGCIAAKAMVSCQ